MRKSTHSRPALEPLEEKALLSHVVPQHPVHWPGSLPSRIVQSRSTTTELQGGIGNLRDHAQHARPGLQLHAQRQRPGWLPWRCAGDRHLFMSGRIQVRSDGDDHPFGQPGFAQAHRSPARVVPGPCRPGLFQRDVAALHDRQRQPGRSVISMAAEPSSFATVPITPVVTPPVTPPNTDTAGNPSWRRRGISDYATGHDPTGHEPTCNATGHERRRPQRRRSRRHRLRRRRSRRRRPRRRRSQRHRSRRRRSQRRRSRPHRLRRRRLRRRQSRRRQHDAANHDATDHDASGDPARWRRRRITGPQQHLPARSGLMHRSHLHKKSRMPSRQWPSPAKPVGSPTFLRGEFVLTFNSGSSNSASYAVMGTGASYSRQN